MIGDATKLAAALRGGQILCTEVMEAAIAASEQHADLGAVAVLDTDLGRARAAAFDALPPDDPRRQAPFAGVPLLVKDLGGPFRGLPIRAGTAALPKGPKSQQSDLAQRFEEAGLLPFGLTTTPEFGLSLTSEPAIGPISRNPLDMSLSSGGSSGGAAAAVAAGIVAIAHATDAGGSIRVPAAACGLYGLKPARGSMPAGPFYGNHLGGIASELAVCRSTRDLAAIYAATSGAARGPFAQSGPLPATGPLRIGVLADDASPARVQAIEEAALALEGRGHRLIPLAPLTDLAARANRLFAEIVCINLAGLATIPSFTLEKAEPLTQAAIARGQAMTGLQVWSITTDMALLARDLALVFDQVDAFVAPMLTDAPRPLGSFPHNHRDIDLHFARMAAFAPLAALANVAGCAALTLPFGRDDRGLPLPVQLFAPMGGESRLLALSQQLEDEGRWTHPFALTGGFDAR